jgi:Double zinc ribbon
VIALVVGTLLAVGALAFVLYPLFRPERPAPARRPAPSREPSPSQLAVDALREIEFDRATGKLSDTDYAELKARYTQQAVAAMRAESSAVAPPALLTDEYLEAEIRRHRAAATARPSCVTCGPRPEPDAVYCSTCGAFLAGPCAHCGATVQGTGARFCAACGHRLAA